LMVVFGRKYSIVTVKKRDNKEKNVEMSRLKM